MASMAAVQCNPLHVITALHAEEEEVHDRQSVDVIVHIFCL